MTHDVTIIFIMNASEIKPLLLNRTIGILLAYLNCHAYILLVVVFTLLG